MKFIITDDKRKVDTDSYVIDYNEGSDTDIIDRIISISEDCSDKKSITVNLCERSKEPVVSYIVNSIADYYEEENRATTIDTIYLFIDKFSNTVLDSLCDNLHKPIMQTVNHSFGEHGDPLKDRFEEFDLQLRGKINFRDYLLSIIDEKGYKKYSEVYKASGVSRYTFSKLLSFDKDHKPSKDTVAAFTIGLRLNLDDAQKLYHIAGYHLGTTELVDRVVRFFISESLYDIDEVNYCLDYYGHSVLGEKLRESIKFEMDEKESL